MPHFSSAELAMMDRMLKKSMEPTKIIKKLAQWRRRRQLAQSSSSAVYRYLAGETYDQAIEETRGRTSPFGKKEMKVYDEQRKKLLAEAANEYVVTWDDIAESGQQELRKRKLLKRSEEGLAATLRKSMRSEKTTVAPAVVGHFQSPSHHL